MSGIRYRPDAMNPHDHPTALQDLQDSIYEERVGRARGMSPEERLDSVFELSDFQLQMMLAGALCRLDTEDEAEGWAEVRRGLARLDMARDSGFYAEHRKSA
ncbi:MAG: hypothetical protein EOP87_01650 [Verrucomicrobiaceae bacterium]|nr:MAG: hypothetical protein EOP87_01650 [Verrucomicrobiaceae bacterium]